MKKRLDVELVDRGLVQSDAQSMVQTCTQWMKEQQTEDFDR